jgi:hypothetical protein
MTDRDFPPRSDVHNTHSGTAENLAQARDIYGGVHFGSDGPPPGSRKKKILVALGGVVVAAIAVWVIVARLSPTPSSASVIAGHVDQCEAQHQLTAQHQMSPTTAGTAVFDSCSWPPSPYADSDGFTEIASAYAPGPDQDQASGATTVDRITGPCRIFDLSYDFGSQGDLKHLKPFRVGAGVVTSLDARGAPWPPGVSGLNFYPSRGEVDVVHNDKNGLANATCYS